MRRFDPDGFRAWLASRGPAADETVREDVRAILGDVAEGGDAALAEWTRRLDGVDPGPAVEPLAAEDLREAWEGLDRDLRRALNTAVERIESFHRRQRPVPWTVEEADGSRLRQRWLPLRRVGVYAPGGRVPYPSTVLMGVVPARVAGCDEIWVMTPPGEGGGPPDLMAAAAYRAGADRLLPAGGAQAVAALAYGTQRLPAVDKLLGPGNAYVQEAKRQLVGRVGIDGFYGPSEIAIIADGSADPAWVAADLIAQAEHAPDTLAVLFGLDEGLADAVVEEVAAQAAERRHADVVRAALEARGSVVTCPDAGVALELVERLAPEHLQLVGPAAEALADEVRCAGALFVGATSPVALGDYVAGPNHTLPTDGTARFAAGLGVDQFMRRMAEVRLSAGASRRLAGPAAVLARAEELEAHAYSLELRAGGGSPKGAGGGSGDGT